MPPQGGGTRPFPILSTEAEESRVPTSERRKEIKRRRHRRKKLALLGRKLEKATVSERAVIADKVRQLTPGGEVIVAKWELEKR